MVRTQMSKTGGIPKNQSMETIGNKDLGLDLAPNLRQSRIGCGAHSLNGEDADDGEQTVVSTTTINSK